MASPQDPAGGSVREEDVPPAEFADRWSKDLVGGPDIRTSSGFSLGIAEYDGTDFVLQVHEDQEALYVIDGEGEVRIGDQVFAARPGAAFYVPPHTPHATRRTGESPVRLVYAHGAV